MWKWRYDYSKLKLKSLCSPLQTLSVSIYSSLILSSSIYKPKSFHLCPQSPRSCQFPGSSCSAAAAAAKLLQSGPTLCDPTDGSPPGSPVPGILQARTLEWVAISFSNAWKWKVKVKSLSHVWLLETPWTAAYQAPPSMGFSRQEYWSGVPLPSTCLCLRWASSFSLFPLLCPNQSQHPTVQALNFPTQGSNPGLPHCRQILYCHLPAFITHPCNTCLLSSYYVHT